jgi:O-antigen ligase
MLRVFVLVTIAVITLIGSDNIYLSPKGNETVCLIAYLCLTCLFATYFYKRISIKETTYVAPSTLVGGLLLVWSAIGFFFTVNLDDSLPFIVKYLGALSWLLALTFYFDSEARIYETLWFLLLLSIPLSIVALIQQYDLSALRYHEDHSSTSIFIQMNLFSCYLVFIAPIAILLYFKSINKVQKILAACAFLLLIPALGFSGSPGGQFTVGIQLAAVCFFYWYFSEKIRFKTLVLGISLGFLIYVILVFGLQPKDMVSSSVEAGESVSFLRRAWIWDHILARFEFWKAAWGIFKDHWIVGSGPWTFNLLYPQYLAENEAVHPHAITAHNLFIQTASDYGLIGLILLISFVTFCLVSALPILKSNFQDRRFLVFCLLLSVVGFFIQGFIEYLLPVSLFLHYLILWVVAIAFLTIKNDVNKKISFRFLYPVGLVSGIASVFVLVWFYIYDDLVNSKVFESRNEQEFFKTISKAKEICPRCDRPHVLTAGFFIEGYKKNQKPGLLRQAEDALVEATRLGHLGYEMDFFRAQIRDLQGKQEEAVFYRKRAKGKSRLGNRNIFTDFNKMNDDAL